MAIAQEDCTVQTFFVAFLVKIYTWLLKKTYMIFIMVIGL